MSKINNNILKLIKYYSLINYKLILSKKALNRYKNFKVGKIEEVDKKLDNLKKLISDVKGCELKKNANNLVFSDGNNKSKIMIVGEGPGANEDKEAKPFVGRAGQLLDKMLQAINLSRKNVYITNVVNYRPPENRKPTEKEIARYLPFLNKHIEIISPKIILLLGSTALSAVLGDNVVISKARGKWYEKKINGRIIHILPTFHPAFLMRQPDQKKFSWIDLKMLKRKTINLKIKID